MHVCEVLSNRPFLQVTLFHRHPSIPLLSSLLQAEDAASVTASVSTSSGSRGSRSSRRGGKRGRNKTNKRRASHQFRGVSGAAPVVTGS